MPAYKKTILKIAGLLLIAGLLGFVAVQFLPIMPHTNPLTVREPNWDSPQTRELVVRACYDCHSNETKWPWYSNIAPVSWLVVRHVQEGRAALNFSEWGVSGETGEISEAKASYNDDDDDEQDEDEADEGEEDERGEGEEVDEMIEEVQEGAMPLPNYLILHPEARLSKAEVNALIAGLKATFGSNAGGAASKSR